MSGYIGKSIRMERIMNRENGKSIIVPMDHGLTVGPIKGIADNLGDMVNKIAIGGANAVLEHKGIIATGYRGFGKDIGLILHLSASTNIGPDPNSKVQVAYVEEAIRLGADAVSFHVNLGSDNEPEQLSAFGSTVKACQEWGMPLLAMIYLHQLDGMGTYIQPD